MQVSYNFVSPTRGTPSLFFSDGRPCGWQVQRLASAVAAEQATPLEQCGCQHVIGKAITCLQVCWQCWWWSHQLQRSMSCSWWAAKLWRSLL